MNAYKTVENKATVEIHEKKSRFIGNIYPIKTEDEALHYISEIKKQNADATHNVYAYVLRDNTIRFSDDKEPQGTAGKPTLEVLLKEKLTDTLVIITRYFGGTLLGAGGLTRAYAQTAKMAVDAAGACYMTPLDKIEITIDYSQFNKIEILLNQSQSEILDKTFGQKITIQLLIEKLKTDNLKKQLKDITAGEAIIKQIGEQYGKKQI